MFSDFTWLLSISLQFSQFLLSFSQVSLTFLHFPWLFSIFLVFSQFPLSFKLLLSQWENKIKECAHAKKSYFQCGHENERDHNDDICVRQFLGWLQWSCGAFHVCLYHICLVALFYPFLNYSHSSAEKNSGVWYALKWLQRCTNGPIKMATTLHKRSHFMHVDSVSECSIDIF